MGFGATQFLHNLLSGPHRRQCYMFFPFNNLCFPPLKRCLFWPYGYNSILKVSCLALLHSVEKDGLRIPALPRSLPAASVWNPLPGSDWAEFETDSADVLVPVAVASHPSTLVAQPTVTTETPPVSRVHSKTDSSAQPVQPGQPAPGAQPSQSAAYPRSLPRSMSKISRDSGRQRRTPSRPSSRSSNSRGLA